MTAEQAIHICKHMTFTSDHIHIRLEKRVMHGPKRVTLAKMRVMGCILQEPDTQMKLKDIAQHLGVSAGAISQTIDSLEKEGELERFTLPDDRRVVHVRLTRKGRTIKASFEQAMYPIMKETTQGISPNDLATFCSVLAHMQANLKQIA